MKEENENLENQEDVVQNGNEVHEIQDIEELSDDEMRELTETEEGDLTGGGSAGKNGYSEFYVQLPVRPLAIDSTGIKGLSITLENHNMNWKYRWNGPTNRIIISIRVPKGASVWRDFRYKLSYVGVDHVLHNLDGRLRFRS